MPKIAVSYTHETLAVKARRLADILNLDCIDQPTSTAYPFLLIFTPDYLGLLKAGEPLKNLFFVDFAKPQFNYRLKHARTNNELLAKSLGCKPHNHPHIIDATAGLGSDAFILAFLGYKLTLLERSPIVYNLLKDALQRASEIPEYQTTVSRIQLIQTNAINWLPLQRPLPDIIYLDPMFPERQKSAAVKKEMTILQQLLGTEPDNEFLLETALACASKRVVVKRPRLAPVFAGYKPSFSLMGRSSRFDVYLHLT